jgi:hypothetical protein
MEVDTMSVATAEQSFSATSNPEPTSQVMQQDLERANAIAKANNDQDEANRLAAMYNVAKASQDPDPMDLDAVDNDTTMINPPKSILEEFANASKSIFGGEPDLWNNKELNLDTIMDVGPELSSEINQDGAPNTNYRFSPDPSQAIQSQYTNDKMQDLLKNLYSTPENEISLQDSDNTPDMFKTPEFIASQATSEATAAEYTYDHDCSGNTCAVCTKNLRPSVRKQGIDVCTKYGNVHHDNDDSGNFIPDPDSPIRLSSFKPPISDERVAEEDILNDEDVVMSGGGIHTAINNLLFAGSGGIPHNHSTANSIKDKNPFLDDSDSSSACEQEIFNSKAKSRSKSKKKKSPKTKAKASVSMSKSIITSLPINSLQSPKPLKKAKQQPKPLDNQPIETNESLTSLLQRLGKPCTTKLSYPIHFNANKQACHLCPSRPRYSFVGHGTRNIKVFDFNRGRGLEEIPPPAVATGAASVKMAPTSVCEECTTKRMRVIMCQEHTLVALPQARETMGFTAAYTRVLNDEALLEAHAWCDICPAPAEYRCHCNAANTSNDATSSTNIDVAQKPEFDPTTAKGCNLHLCNLCASQLLHTHANDLQVMLSHLPDDKTEVRPLGLRADVELLRKRAAVTTGAARQGVGARATGGAELWGFMMRESRKMVVASASAATAVNSGSTGTKG